MKKRIKRKIKIKMITKIIITIFIFIVGLQIYYDLALLGTFLDKTIIDKTLLYFGWFWLIMGQFVILHFVWED